MCVVIVGCVYVKVVSVCFTRVVFYVRYRSVMWSLYDGVIIIPPFLSLFISFILLLKMFVVSCIMSSVVVVVVVMLSMMTCVVKDDMM